MQEYEVEVFVDGEPKVIITLNTRNEDSAVRRARMAYIHSYARDIDMDRITANIYEGTN